MKKMNAFDNFLMVLNISIPFLLYDQRKIKSHSQDVNRDYQLF